MGILRNLSAGACLWVGVACFSCASESVGTADGEQLVEEQAGLNVVIPATGRSDCLDPKPAGSRPKCAHTVWNDGIDTCTIDRFQGPNCSCYEGQTKSCLMSNQQQLCSGGEGCGVRYCKTPTDMNSAYGACQ